MDKVTRQGLYEKIQYLRSIGHDLGINFQRTEGWRGRITDTKGERDRSPRLKVGELDLWLDGYLDGYRSATKRILAPASALAELAEGLDVNQKAGPIHEDFLAASRMIREIKQNT